MVENDNKDSLPHTTFSKQLINMNHLATAGFSRWAFYPGMLFGSHEKWWDSHGMRQRPHEGIDLAQYCNKEGKISALGAAAAVPAVYPGTVIAIIDDFISRSIILRHNITNRDGWRLHSVYAHINPLPKISSAPLISEGEPIGTIAPVTTLAESLQPHLHLSLAWISRDFPNNCLDWDTLTLSKQINLINPLLILPEHMIL